MGNYKEENRNQASSEVFSGFHDEDMREAIPTLSSSASPLIDFLQPRGVQLCQFLAGFSLPAAKLEDEVPSLLLLPVFLYQIL